MNRVVPYGGRVWEDALRLTEGCFDAHGRRRDTSRPVSQPPRLPDSKPPRLPDSKPSRLAAPDVDVLGKELRRVEEENAILRRHIRLLTRVYQSS